MIGWLEIVVLVGLGMLAVFGIALTVAGRPPGRELRLAVIATTALLVVQAGIAAYRVLTGVTLPETSTFLIYLVVSVGVLPIALQFAAAGSEGGGTEDEGPTRWGGAVVAVAAIAVGVAVLRLQGLWLAGTGMGSAGSA